MAFLEEGHSAKLVDSGSFTLWHRWVMPWGERIEYWRGDYTALDDGPKGALRYLSAEGDMVRIDILESRGAAMRAAIKCGCAVPGMASLGGDIAPEF